MCGTEIAGADDTDRRGHDIARGCPNPTRTPVAMVGVGLSDGDIVRLLLPVTLTVDQLDPPRMVPGRAASQHGRATGPGSRAV